LVAAALLAGWGYLFLDANAHLGPGQPTTDAVVVGFEARAWVLEFTVDGRTVRAATEDVVGRPDVGDVIRVRYDPDDPELYVRDVDAEPTPGWLIIGTFAAAAAFLVGAVRSVRPLWFRRRSRSLQGLLLCPGLTRWRIHLRDGDIGLRYWLADATVGGEATNTSPRPLEIPLPAGLHRLELEVTNSAVTCRWAGVVDVPAMCWVDKVDVRPVVGRLSAWDGAFSVELARP